MGEPDTADERDPDSLADLLAIALLTVIVGLFAFVSPLSDTPLRPVFSLAFVLFAPGYTYLGVLFPKRDVSTEPSDDASPAGRGGAGLGLLERFAFSFGLSVAITILFGLALGFRTPGITRVNLYVGLAAFTAVGLPLAAKRRTRQPADVRMRSPHRSVMTRVRSIFAGQETAPSAVAVLLAVVLVAAIASVGVGEGSPQGGEVTELYLLSENESGEYVPRGYPETVARGENESFALGITNQEGERVAYTVVVLLQEFEEDVGGNSMVVETQVRTLSADLNDGESERIPHSIGPTVDDGSYRLTYLLYAGPPPSDPSIDNAYREVHLWMRVTDPAE